MKSGNEIERHIPIAKPILGEEEKKAVWKVMESGALAQGKVVAELERNFADFIRVKHAIATTNGTTALHLALLSAGIGEGDEVITTPFSFMASVTSIIFTGARPVFADINPETFTLDPASVRKALTPRTKAIMPVHLYGQSADMDPLLEIAEENDLMIIEDACQAHGAEYRGRKVGALGDMAAFSFYPTKNMTTGEGGMITTNNEEFAEMARLLRNHGQSSRYAHSIVGYNFRMTDIHAAIGVVQLRRLKGFNIKRMKNAEKLSQGMKDLSGVELPVTASYGKHVFHQYTIRSENRDALRNFLAARGIATGIYYPKVLYDYPAIKPFFNGTMRESERAAKEVLSLPVHPSLTEEELDYIIDSVKEWAKVV